MQPALNFRFSVFESVVYFLYRLHNVLNASILSSSVSNFKILDLLGRTSNRYLFETFPCLACLFWEFHCFLPNVLNHLMEIVSSFWVLMFQFCFCLFFFGDGFFTVFFTVLWYTMTNANCFSRVLFRFLTAYWKQPSSTVFEVFPHGTFFSFYSLWYQDNIVRLGKNKKNCWFKISWKFLWYFGLPVESFLCRYYQRFSFPPWSENTHGLLVLWFHSVLPLAQA